MQQTLEGFFVGFGEEGWRLIVHCYYAHNFSTHSC